MEILYIGGLVSISFVVFNLINTEGDINPKDVQSDLDDILKAEQEDRDLLRASIKKINSVLKS